MAKLTIEIPDQVYEDLQKVAEATELSIERLVSFALNEFVEAPLGEDALPWDEYISVLCMAVLSYEEDRDGFYISHEEGMRQIYDKIKAAKAEIQLAVR